LSPRGFQSKAGCGFPSRSASKCQRKKLRVLCRGGGDPRVQAGMPRNDVPKRTLTTLLHLSLTVLVAGVVLQLERKKNSRLLIGMDRNFDTFFWTQTLIRFKLTMEKKIFKLFGTINIYQQ
jgi:hypothetical protein